MKIAILGVTGYVGRSLARECVIHGFAIDGYSRDIVQAHKILSQYELDAEVSLLEYEQIGEHEYDILINATGIGSPRTLSQNPQAVFSVTEEMDARIFEYLQKYPKTLVFNLSSGAIYGESAGSAVGDGARAVFRTDMSSPASWYGIAKFASEAKHRTHPEYTIIDLRVFAFCSRYMDTTDTFLLSQIVASLQSGVPLTVSKDDMVRDFTTAQSILDVILFFAERCPENIACDMQSVAPVTKFDLLEYCLKTWGLQYEIKASGGQVSPTQQKNIYCSQSTVLATRGYVPKESSLAGITRELSFLQSTFKAP